MQRLILTTSIICLMGTLLFLVSPDVDAGPRDQPAPLPGWTHSPRFSDDTPQQHGIILSGGPITRSSPVIAEIDGNPDNHYEVAVGGRDGRLYVYGSEGTQRWAKDIHPDNCNAPSSLPIHSSPAVGELFNNDIPYVVVGYGPGGSSDCPGGVAAFDGRNGRLLWRFDLSVWAAQEGFNERFSSVMSSPTLADTDGDGIMEIGFGGLDRRVYLLNADGSVRWYYSAADTVFSSPAFVNIDSDSELEMIIGTDISNNTELKTPDGGYIYAFDTQPRTPPLITFQQPGGYIWRTTVDQAVHSSPVIGDVLPDQPGAEIVIGSSCYFPESTTNLDEKRGRWLKILRLNDGAVLQTLEANACLRSSVALGDLDNDGLLEIVATVNTPSVPIACQNRSSITAWKATNPKPIWSRSTGDPNSGCNDGNGADIQSPVIADLDGNGSLEVIAANFWSVHVLQGTDGNPLTCQGPDCGGQMSLFAWGTLKSTPAVGDINKDGKLDLVIGGTNIPYTNNKGMLYAWTDFAGVLNSPAGNQSAYSAPWPMFHGNPQHTGVFAEPVTPRINLSLPEIGAIISPNRSRSYAMSITNADNSPLNWSITENDPHNLVQLSQTSGTSAKPLYITIAVPNRTTSLELGRYTASLTITAAGLPDITMPITVRVVDQIYDVYLPLTVR